MNKLSAPFPIYGTETYFMYVPCRTFAFPLNVMAHDGRKNSAITCNYAVG